ncbi:MAG: secretin N-terminal domain-containing protein [Planctomycetota bacterium]
MTINGTTRRRCRSAAWVLGAAVLVCVANPTSRAQAPDVERSRLTMVGEAVTAPSADNAPASLPLGEALNRRGDLTLQGNSLSEALMTISELWKINIVAAEVPGSVNGVFKDAPLKEILDAILISNGYGYRAVGESLVVTDLAKLGRVNPFFESATIPVAAAEVNEVVSGAQLLSTPQGQIRALPSASSVFVLDFPDRVKMIREFILSVDNAARRARGEAPLTPAADDRGDNATPIGPQRLEVAYMKTHFVEAAAAQTVLQTVLSPLGRVAAMEEENRLLVVDTAENLQMAASVLERIDRPRPQVAIRALIYDLSLQDKETLGLNWQSLSGGDSSPSIAAHSLDAGTLTTGTGTMLNSVTTVPAADDAVGSSFSFFTLNSNLNLSAVAVALQEAADSRLLASPNVTVLDNTEASIESVSEIPFQQLTQTAGGGNIGTTAFRDAGVSLKVTPRIALDGTIDMLVRPEFSRLTGFTPGDNQPIIDRRTADTRVRVASGQTFVIAGLRQRTDVGDFRGVPFLKDVRFLGHLFRGRDTEVQESELVVFLTPVIVSTQDPLSPRDIATADTVRCRLEAIPQAEGCHPGCDGYALGGVCNECTTGPTEVIVAPTGAPIPPPSPAGMAPIPTPTESVPTGSATPDALQQPDLAWRGKTRRLPPIDGSPEIIVASRPQRTASRPEANPRRLRPDYADRFRASGGVYPSQQRGEPAGEAKSAEEPKERGFWSRTFMR